MALQVLCGRYGHFIKTDLRQWQETSASDQQWTMCWLTVLNEAPCNSGPAQALNFMQTAAASPQQARACS